MDFYAVLDEMAELLRSRGRVSYRALKEHFGLDDERLDALRTELLYSHPDTVSEEGPVRALTFPVNRKGGRYIAGLSDDQLTEMLATACGFRGSMAEYLFSTVSMLEELGIHDRNLWRLQEMVADRIDAAYRADQQD